MNKLKLIEIIKQLIMLQKKGTLSADTYQIAENNTPLMSLSNDLVSYKETELICYLFKEIPYYQIFIFLNNLCINLAIIKNEKPELGSTINLIEAYISDLLKNIAARTETEVAVHIYSLVKNFYQYGFLNSEKTISNLQKNSCIPENLTGMGAAENMHYEQTTITGFVVAKEELRETISKTNYKKRSSIENRVQKTIIQFFDEESFEKFLEALKKCFDDYKKQNLRDAEILEEEIMMQLKLFYHKAKVAWKKKREEKKEEDGYQYKIEFSAT